MSIIRSDLVEEIRINKMYTQYYLSEFPDTSQSPLQDESKPIIVKRTLFTNDYMKKLSGPADKSRGIIPPNCRYIESTNKGHLVIIEEPPALRTIKIQKFFEQEVSDLRETGQLKDFGYGSFNSTSSDPHSFTLAFPYVIFILVVERDSYIVDGLVFLRTQEMRGMSDYLFKAPLNNISNNQRVCFGEPNKFKSYSLTQCIQNLIMVFWSATFNTDYTYNYEAYRKAGSEFGNYLRWEYLTRQNPLFIYDAKWIDSGSSLGAWIDRIKTDDHLTGEIGLDYKKATQMVFSPVLSDKQALLNPKSKTKLPLYHDIANGMYVGDYFLSIGDPFINSRGEPIYIDSFIGFSDGGNIKYIMVDKNGKRFMMKLTKKLKNYIAASNKTIRYTNAITLPNNVEVKIGDILVFRNKRGSEFYGKVEFIRAGRDGRPEIKIGHDYYLAENIEGEKFQMKTPTLYGIELKKGDRYIMIHNFKGSSPMLSGSPVTYDSVNISSAAKIDFQFTNNYVELLGNKYHLPLKTNDEYRISSSRNVNAPKLFRESDVKSFTGLFRVGKKIFYLARHANDTDQIASEALAWELPNNLGIAVENNTSLRRPKAGMIKDLLINETTFRLPGFLLDLEFSIGDKVVVADWKNPYEILRVKEIAGFSLVEHSGRASRGEDLYFILSDKDGKLSKVKYVYGYSAACHIGKVRKITNIFNRVTSGTKIIANASGYAGFPKSAVNIIIGFITDTGGQEPLVLCSNGQTLWFNDMMTDFTRVTMRSKKWADLKHAPIDLSKIKLQPGDIINGSKEYTTTEGYVVTNIPSSYRGLRAQLLEYFTGYPETHGIDSRFTREYIYECIPNPRLRPSQIDNFGLQRGWPNFHGLFYHSEKSEYHFINQPGRFLDVPSSDK